MKRAMATVRSVAGDKESAGRLQQQLEWRATKRAMVRAARATAMATKRAMSTDGNNTDNGYCK
jgi:hypothetical protein